MHADVEVYLQSGLSERVASELCGFEDALIALVKSSSGELEARLSRTTVEKQTDLESAIKTEWSVTGVEIFIEFCHVS